MRALLASMVFLERFLAPKNNNLGIENGVFCECVLASLGICWALVFGRFSLRLSSGIWSLRAWREKGAYGFRPIKTNGFSRFFNVREAAGRAARQTTGYQTDHKIAPPKTDKFAGPLARGVSDPVLNLLYSNSLILVRPQGPSGQN